MSKKFMLIVALLLIVPTLLAACGGGLSEDDAEKGIKAGFEGDRDEAGKYICDGDLGEMGGESAMPEGVDYSVSCKKDGEKMSCDIEVSNLPEEMGGEMTLTMNADIEDDKLCNIELELPQP